MASPFAIPKIEYGNFIPTVISFNYPPSQGQKRDAISIVSKDSESLSGVRQTQVNYFERNKKLKFRFLSEDDVDDLETFIVGHAGKGKAFKYFEDKNSADYIAYELDMKKFDPKPITAVGVDIYIYEVDLVFRRVEDQAAADGYMSQAIENDQSAPADISSLILNSDEYKSARVFYEIFRRTTGIGAEERVSNGYFVCLYKESTDSWTLEPGAAEGEPYHGVTFSVTAGGQVQYTSDEMAGSNYQGELILRNFTIVGG